MVFIFVVLGPYQRAAHLHRMRAGGPVAALTRFVQEYLGVSPVPAKFTTDPGDTLK